MHSKVNRVQMSSLADLPEVIGFFSYSREDDEAYEGTLSALRDAIQRELSAQLGRSRTNFRLWQDQKAIAPGKLWESEIKTAVKQAVFFIPIVTPRAVNSHYCQFEFEEFLAREQELGRSDLVFPLLYIRVPALEREAQWRNDPVLSIVGMRQYVDWRPLRHLDARTPTVREQIERFCDKVVEALREPWISPEERRVEAARLAEEERQQVEAARRGEAERQRAEAARRAEEEKRQAEQARAPAETKTTDEAWYVKAIFVVLVVVVVLFGIFGSERIASWFRDEPVASNPAPAGRVREFSLKPRLPPPQQAGDKSGQ
jgi:hypothetical protein